LDHNNNKITIFYFKVIQSFIFWLHYFAIGDKFLAVSRHLVLLLDSFFQLLDLHIQS